MGILLFYLLNSRTIMEVMSVITTMPFFVKLCKHEQLKCKKCVSIHKMHIFKVDILLLLINGEYKNCISKKSDRSHKN